MDTIKTRRFIFQATDSMYKYEGEVETTTNEDAMLRIAKWLKKKCGRKDIPDFNIWSTEGFSCTFQRPARQPANQGNLKRMSERYGVFGWQYRLS